MTFCWLPPDSVSTATSMPGVRTSNSRDEAFGLVVDRAVVSRMPRRENGAWW